MEPKYKIGQKYNIMMPLQVKSIDKENFTLTMVASTQDEDRHGDVVIQSGWILDNFLKNPVILNSHRYDDMTEIIAKATRTEIIGKGKKSRLEQDWKFAVNENPKAKIIFDLYANEFASASSVGFIVRKFKQNQDGTTDWYTIEEAELLEVSGVSVPANARALAKAKGINVDELNNNEEDNDEDNDTNDDDVSEVDEVKDDNEQTVAENSDDSESESEADNDEAGSDQGDSGSGEDTDNQEEEVVEPEVKAESYKSKIAKVLSKMEAKEKSNLQAVLKIVNSLLEENDLQKVDEQTKQKIKSRKINKAIRSLLQIK